MRLILLATLIAVTLAACGRRGPPSPPGPANAINYPHTYPSE